MFPKSNFSSQDRPQKKKRLYAINKKMNELRRSPSGTTLLDFDGAAIDRKSSNLSSSTNSAQLSQTSPRAGLVRESAQQNHEQKELHVVDDNKNKNNNNNNNNNKRRKRRHRLVFLDKGTR